MRKKHNYPKTRKNRNVGYSKSYKLLQAVGEKKLRELFSIVGMYLASKELTKLLGYEISPFVVRHCRMKYKLSSLNDENPN
jgi:hypothetical protein